MNHTKGIWSASEPKKQADFGNQTYFSIQTDVAEIVGEGENKTYKAVGFYYPHSVQSEEEMRANAILLASAPTLLAALQELLKEYKFALQNHVDILAALKIASKAVLTKNAENNSTVLKIESLLKELNSPKAL